MRRLVGLAAVAAAVLAPVLAVPSPASAADGPITALAGRVALGGNPWTPGGELAVEVANGAAAQKGFFRLRLPHTVELESAKGCTPVAGEERTWTCGGDVIAAGGRRTYTFPVRSTIAEPAFEIVDEGWVEGRTVSGEGGGRVEFTIRWPDKLPLRLAATAGAVTNGTAELDVKVTNAGTFTMGGYSLMVKTPKGVTVVSPACSDSGRMNGVGCELYRSGTVKAGATDRFTVRVKATSTPVTLNLFLAPTNRYTNKDTKLDLTLKAATTGGGANEPTLPVTGSSTTPILFGVGGGLVALGAALLLLLRRRRVVVVE